MRPPDRDLRGVIAKLPWGWAYVVWSGQQIVGLELMSTRACAVQQARRRFPGVRAVARTTAPVPATMECLIRGAPPPHAVVGPHGTRFQHAVWKAIRDIPAGRTRSYREIAEDVGRPKAVRAVAMACAANPVALLIPCHRVIASDGSLGGYRWGVRRKRALLRAEAS